MKIWQNEKQPKKIFMICNKKRRNFERGFRGGDKRICLGGGIMGGSKEEEKSGRGRRKLGAG